MGSCAGVAVEAWVGALLIGCVSALGCGSANTVGAASPEPAASPSGDGTTASPAPAGVSSASAAPAGASSAAKMEPAAAAPSAANAAPPDRSLNDIRAVVAQNREGFRACFDRAAQAHTGLKGTFTLKFVLSPDGSVKSAEADPAKSQIHAPEMETCAVAVLRGIKFPISRRGMESTVSYPFDFNPKVVSSKPTGATSP
jgi:outer membrane biosynthesis protein TonB